MTLSLPQDNLLFNMKNLIGLKELREHADTYITAVQRGESFIVVRRSKPIFKMSPVDEGEEAWEEVADFTKVKKGGVALGDLLARL